jgi:hypothetical protein
MRDDLDDRDHNDRDYDDRPAYPLVVTIAGISWIVFGAVIIVNALLILVLVAAAPAGPAREGIMAGVGCLSVFLGLFAAAFIFVGVQSVRGTAPGTIGNGIGSIVFALINAGSLAVQIGRRDFLQAGLAGLFALGLLAAGILALVGSADYQTWRRAHRRRRGRRDDADDGPRRRRRDYGGEDDYDRPRRRRPPDEDDLNDDPPRRRPRPEDPNRDEGRYRPD